MEDNTIIEFKRPASASADPLTDLLRKGARELLVRAVEAELEDFLSQFNGLRLEDGRQAIVRNGFLPEREIQTGIGPVAVKVPKVRDRTRSGIKFNSKLLPPYLKRTASVETLLPWLYLKGISSGDFKETLVALVGEKAKGLSPQTIGRLKKQWEEEPETWAASSLAGKRYVYWWADGIYFNVRGDDARSCILVVIGANERGEKEFVALEEGLRESEQSWLEVLSSLKQRGLAEGPALAVGDGALGFWKALTKTFGETRHQRCWVHKTGNVLNKLPKSSQKQAKSMLHNIWQAETKKAADIAFGLFVDTYQDKYPKATACLEKDRDLLLSFYDFPAAHWQHIRTTNPVESTFATVRLRTDKTRGCVSRRTILAMVYKLGQSAKRRWRRLRGFKHLAEVIEGVRFVDGVKQSVEEPLGSAA
ncbi:MAG: IS256 family transposase [Vulcanimicrobiota bacterium]